MFSHRATCHVQLCTCRAVVNEAIAIACVSRIMHAQVDIGACTRPCRGNFRTCVSLASTLCQANRIVRSLGNTSNKILCEINFTRRIHRELFALRVLPLFLLWLKPRTMTRTMVRYTSQPVRWKNFESKEARTRRVD